MKVPEQFRVTTGRGASRPRSGNNGVFMIPVPKRKKELFQVIASDGEGWEHVSVSLEDRDPTWSEMCYIKDLFWDSEDTVIQYHPPKKEYMNQHQHCLHLWKPINIEFPRPEMSLVGFTGFDDLIASYLGTFTKDDYQTKQKVARAMIAYGGSFVKRLGMMLQTADRSNTLIIKTVWPDYWKNYLEIAHDMDKKERSQ